LTFEYEGIRVSKELTTLPGIEIRVPRDGRVNKLTLPARPELIVQVPVKGGSRVREGLVERAELMPGVYMAESLVKVNNGCVITSVINTTEEEVEVLDHTVKLEEMDDSNASEVAVMGVTELENNGSDQKLSRGERVISKLREEHLNEEEKKLLDEICFQYQDVFYLPGDKLSCTNAARHSIQLEPGVTPINTRPYRLPES
jgi:hypothetical protein